MNLRRLVRTLPLIAALAAMAPAGAQSGPVISRLEPTGWPAGSFLVLSVFGSGFAANSRIVWARGDQQGVLDTTLINSNELRASIAPSHPMLSVSGPIRIFVYNDFGDGGPRSNQIPFEVTPRRVLLSINPTRVQVASEFTLTARGSGFQRGDRIALRRRGLSTGFNFVDTEFISSAELRTLVSGGRPGTILYQHLSSPGIVDVDLTFCHGTSDTCAATNKLPLTVEGGLELTNLTPNSTLSRATGASQEILLAGSGFVRGQTRVLWRTGGQTVEIGGRFTSANEMVAIIPGNLLTQAVTAFISVRNPGSTGSSDTTSNELPFNVIATLELTRLDPPSIPAGSGDTTLLVYGSGLSDAIRIRFTPTAGSPFTPAGQRYNRTLNRMEVPLARSQLGLPARYSVAAVDTANQNRVSNTLQFEVTSRATILSLTPPSARAKSGDFALTILGSGFASDSRVLFGARELAPNSRTTDRITVTIPADAITVPRGIPVKVLTPGGAESNAVDFRVDDALVILSLTPPRIAAGSDSFSMAIDGSGFANGARVRFGRQPDLTPTRVEPRRIQVTIPREALTTAGPFPVTVILADGEESNRVDFTVSPPEAISLTSLNPSARVAGSGDFNLTVSGRNMLPDPRVTFAGIPLAVAPGATATSLTVTVPAAAIALAGDKTLEVTVNGRSASLPLRVTAPQVQLTLNSASVRVDTTGNSTASVRLAAPATARVTGTLRLTFEPNAAAAGVDFVDPGLKFTGSGRRTLDFSIDRDQNAAALSSQGRFDVGATAGNVLLSVASMTVAGQSATPPPQPVRVEVPRSRPVIASVALVNRAGGVTVEAVGHTPSREITGATIAFTIASGAEVEGSRSFTIPAAEIGSRFRAFFTSADGVAAGSAFKLTIPFPVEGDVSQITGVSVTLDNAEGSSAAVAGGR
ncbi:MAG: IPT/TIG domain-containing protein [Bryobacteraceae bacterium]